MAYYAMQTAYTPLGWAALLKDPQHRLEAVRPVIERLGGTIVNGWFAFGEYDLLVICDMPDNIQRGVLDRVAMNAAPRDFPSKKGPADPQRIGCCLLTPRQPAAPPTPSAAAAPAAPASPADPPTRRGSPRRRPVPAASGAGSGSRNSSRSSRPRRRSSDLAALVLVHVVRPFDLQVVERTARRRPDDDRLRRRPGGRLGQRARRRFDRLLSDTTTLLIACIGSPYRSLVTNAYPRPSSHR